MYILYDNLTGKPYAVIRNSQWDDWSYYNTREDENGKYWILHPDGTDNVHLPLDLFDLEENEDNRTLCRDILYTNNAKDEVGDQKYSIKAGKINPKSGWEEFFPDSNIGIL